MAADLSTLMRKLGERHGQWRWWDGSFTVFTSLPEQALTALQQQQVELDKARARLAELEALINSPETNDWLKGAELEAAHQIERWGAEHDTGKSAWDWFWLIGYLAQKAAAAEAAGDKHKAQHHTISTAAALLNWHRHLTGANQRMRPGIDPIERGLS